MVFAITFWKCKTKKRRFGGIIYVKKKSYSHGANRYRIPNAKFGLLGVFGVDPKAFIVHFSQDFWKSADPRSKLIIEASIVQDFSEGKRKIWFLWLKSRMVAISIYRVENHKVLLRFIISTKPSKSTKFVGVTIGFFSSMAFLLLYFCPKVFSTNQPHMDFSKWG